MNGKVQLKVFVRNETLGEALKFIMLNKRAVLLLSYFMDYRDTDIARTFKITCATVAYRRKQALQQLKALLEDKIDV
jgi:DNA-directed RNA polymerase specialized sigma24 family protein